MRTLPALLPILLMTSTIAKTPDLPDLQRMIARYASVDLRVDTSKLSPQDSRALNKLIAAAKLIDDLFLDQYWSADRDLYNKLQQDSTPLSKATLTYFRINESPWSALTDLP